MNEQDSLRGISYDLDNFSEISAQMTRGYFNYMGQEAAKFNLQPSGSISVNISQLTLDGQYLAKLALDAWSAVTGVVFLYQDAFAQINFDDVGGSASGYYKSRNGIIQSSTVNIGIDWLKANGSSVGSYTLQTYIHEIGHALGLGHPGNYDAELGSATKLFSNDSWAVSIMSYFSQTANTGSGASFAYVVSPQIADIAAIYSIYGVNSRVGEGDTVYGVGATGSIVQRKIGEFLQLGELPQPISFTLIDYSGNDLVNFSTDVRPAVIDLHPGAASSVYGSINNVIIEGSTLIESVISGVSNDRIDGNNAPNYVDSNLGNDIIFGLDGSDTLIGGGGNDYLFGGRSSNVLSGGTGDDFIEAGSDGDFIESGSGQDHVLGGAGNDTIYGGSDGDLLESNLGNNFIDGGDGNDTAFCVIGFDTVVGGEGSDSIFGGAGKDSLGGSQDDDTIYGGDDDDFCDGGSGNDSVFGNNGNDFLSGSDGIDLVDAGAGNDTAFGGSGSDIIYGGTGDDALQGEEGNDYLSSGQGNDWANGGVGDDSIVGFNGRDTLIGGDGSDHIFGEQDDDNVGGGSGNDAIYGGDGDDTLFGEGGVDLIYGGSSADLIYGGLAGDSLDGGPGNDLLFGNLGWDVISGGDGDDTIVGGMGRDMLSGGMGRDVFCFASLSQSLIGQGDLISDFQQGLDLFDLSLFRSEGNDGAPRGFRFIGDHIFGGSQGELRFSTDGEFTYIRGDYDGNSVAEFSIMLKGVFRLVPEDFLL